MARKKGKNQLGQSTIEYVLILAFGAIFSVQVIKFFNGVFQEGLVGLEQNIESEMATGQGFAPGGN